MAGMTGACEKQHPLRLFKPMTDSRLGHPFLTPGNRFVCRLHAYSSGCYQPIIGLNRQQLFACPSHSSGKNPLILAVGIQWLHVTGHVNVAL